MTTNQERRKHTRYEQSNLSIRVSRPGIAGFLRFNANSTCVDFSLSGMQFTSAQKFSDAQKIILDLQVGDVSLTELPARVIGCDALENAEYCTRIRFALDSPKMRNPRTMHGLLQIEDRLRVNQEYPPAHN